jgi:tRNA-specific 2-thiouridylase
VAVRKPKVVLAMSGGVDSSVAAALLLQEGYEVLGCFMRLGNPEGVEIKETCDVTTGKTHKQGCCSVNDAADARRVADRLGIPLYVLNFQKDFGRVIDYFTSEYAAGRTPNPCVRCNDWLKFGKLHDYAAAIGADFVASGHYARVQDGRLLRGIDHAKDQSYVLFGVPRDHLSRMLLPVGGFEKPAIRAMAEELDLPVFDKPDSQEICFVPDQDYAGLLERRGGDLAEGEIVTVDGDVVGEHRGYQRYTVGQRRGLRLALGKPVYVVGTEPANNRVIVGGKADLLAESLVAEDINLLNADAARAFDGLGCQAKIRYNADPVPATMYRAGDDRIRVVFDEPQSAVAPGQAVVCYDGDRLLGGGWIRESQRASGS